MPYKELEYGELVDKARGMALSILSLKVPRRRDDDSDRANRMQWALAAEMIQALADALEELTCDRSKGDS